MRAASIFTLVACTVSTGCVYTGSGQPVPTADRKPANMVFDTGSTDIIGERFMLLPVDLDSRKTAFGSGSVFVSPSAWSGSSFGTYHPDQAVNIVIADLADGTHHRVFDHPVAVGGWGMSYLPNSNSILRFKDTLLFSARTHDRNQDKYLTDQDPLWLYRYSLNRRELTRISPSGYQVVRTDLFETYVLMMLVRETSDATTQPAGRVSIYRYDVESGQGKMVVENLEP